MAHCPSAFVARILALIAVSQVQYSGAVSLPSSGASTKGLIGVIGNKLFYTDPTVRTTWLGAVEFCHETGMSIASVQSEEENTLLSNYIVSEPSGTVYSFWLGATDLGSEGAFYWFNGDPINYSGFETKKTGIKPKELYNYDCVAQLWAGHWVYDNCYDLHNPVCQLV